MKYPRIIGLYLHSLLSNLILASPMVVLAGLGIVMNLESWHLNFYPTIKMKNFYHIKNKFYLYFNILKTHFTHFTLLILPCHSDPIHWQHPFTLHPKPPLTVALSPLVPPSPPLSAATSPNHCTPGATTIPIQLFGFVAFHFFSIREFDRIDNGHVKFQQKFSKNTPPDVIYEVPVSSMWYTNANHQAKMHHGRRGQVG